MNITDKLNFLQIQEVTTDRQKANGTREFKLPVRDQYGAAIHVASFASGYVRRTKAGGYCPSWQLNKTKTIKPTKDYRWPSKERILIPIEIDRLEYMMILYLLGSMMHMQKTHIILVIKMVVTKQVTQK